MRNYIKKNIITMGTIAFIMGWTLVVLVNYKLLSCAYLNGTLSLDKMTMYKMVNWVLISILGLIIGYILNKYHMDSYIQATTDHLTKLYNRSFLNDYLLREYSKCNRQKGNIALILIDIDYFKAYNDTYGHIQGDHCLRQVADILKKSAGRDYDVVARYGGEEFIVIISNPIMFETVTVIVNKIRNNLRQANILHKTSHFKQITVSIGTVEDKLCTYDIKNIIHKADTALYVAKDSGRDQVISYNNLSGNQKQL